MITVSLSEIFSQKEVTGILISVAFSFVFKYIIRQAQESLVRISI